LLKTFKIRKYTRADKDAGMLAFKSNVPQFFAEHEARDFENWLDNLHEPDKDDIMAPGQPLLCWRAGKKNYRLRWVWL
jgi:hypothetical protein